MSKIPAREPSATFVEKDDPFEMAIKALTFFETVMGERALICPVILFGLLTKPPSNDAILSFVSTGDITGYTQLDKFSLEQRREILDRYERILNRLRQHSETIG